MVPGHRTAAPLQVTVIVLKEQKSSGAKIIITSF